MLETAIRAIQGMHLDILHDHCEEIQIAIPIELSVPTIADGDMWNATDEA